jgi:hypothetical protein
VPGGHLNQLGVAVEPGGPGRTAERRMGDGGEAELFAPFEQPAPPGPIVERAQRHLDGGQRDDGERLVELAEVHVADPHPPDETFLEQAAQGPDRGPPRGAGVGCVQQVQVDGQAVEGGQARLAVGPDRSGPPVGDPAAVAGHASLGDDAGGAAGGVAAQGAGQQPLTVAEVGGAVSVGPGGVEHREAGGEGGGDDLVGPIVVGFDVGGEAHAAEPNAPFGGFQPASDGPILAAGGGLAPPGPAAGAGCRVRGRAGPDCEAWDDDGRASRP